MTAETPSPKKVKRRGPRTVRSFYDKALSEAERADLQSALAMDGLDHEIAILRLRLRAAIADGVAFSLMLRGIEMLARAVTARYRLSPSSQEQIERALRNVLTESERLEKEGGDGE